MMLPASETREFSHSTATRVACRAAAFISVVACRVWFGRAEHVCEEAFQHDQARTYDT
jgi:hypothetical protein